MTTAVGFKKVSVALDELEQTLSSQTLGVLHVINAAAPLYGADHLRVTAEKSAANLRLISSHSLHQAAKPVDSALKDYKERASAVARPEFTSFQRADRTTPLNRSTTIGAYLAREVKVSSSTYSDRLNDVLVRIGIGLQAGSSDMEEGCSDLLPKKHVLILTARYDHNGIRNGRHQVNVIKEIDHLYSARHQMVNATRSLCGAIDEETLVSGPIDIVFIRAHSEKMGMTLDDVETLSVWDKLPTSSCLRNLPPHATIVLSGCSSGKGREEAMNIANHFAKYTHPDVRIIAPEDDNTDFEITQAHPINISYNNRNNNSVVPAYVIDETNREKIASRPEPITNF